MDTKFKNFIFNGLTYGIIFFLLGFLMSYYTFHFSLKNAVLNAAPIGIVALVINGLIQSRFTKSSKALNAIKIVLNDGEILKLEAHANHIIDDHLISGKLFLTETELTFISFDREEYSWPLINLQILKFHPSIFNTGGEFIVEDENQNKLIFEVDEIRAWKKH